MSFAAEVGARVLEAGVEEADEPRVGVDEGPAGAEP